MSLTVHGNVVHGLFRLLGDNENSATYAVGWALDRCPSFRHAFLRKIGVRELPKGEPLISLQRRDRDRGFTDIELKDGQSLHVIVEAKVGWLLPTERQLRRYARRFPRPAPSSAHLVTMSATPSTIAAFHGVKKVGRVAVKHLSWSDVRSLARRAHAETRRIEDKRWLRVLESHLEEFVAMDRRTSNEVYVLALKMKPIKRGNSYSWVDVVEQDECYFHPVGGAWPLEPPNYLGFRYRGRLQSVRHVESTTIVADLRSVDPRWPKTHRPHFVYRLGPPMFPAKEVRTGKVFRGARVRCAIDTLLSGRYATISKARDATKRRLEREGG